LWKALKISISDICSLLPFLIDFAFGIHEHVPEQTSQVNMQTNKLRSRHNIGLLESLKTPQLACFRFDSCSFCSGSHFHA
jgi:hypothetical protein